MQKMKVDSYSIVIAAYFIYLLFLIKLSLNDSSFNLLTGFVPLALLSLQSIVKKSTYRKEIIQASSSVLIFYLFYYMLSFFNVGTYLRGITFFVTILVNIAAIFLLLNSPRASNIKNTTVALLIVSVCAVFIPHYLLVKNLQFGAFYNLLSSDLITTTTVEGPLIIALLFSVSAYDLTFNKSISVLNILSMLFSVYVLLLFSRRGFIFSSLIALGIYYLYQKLSSKIILYSSMILMLLPFYWNLISGLLVDAFKTNTVSSVIKRSSTSEIVTATGRAESWEKIIKLFYSFRTNLFFGYPGGPPEDLFIQVHGERGRYSHAHNTFLQLFLQGGYFVCTIFLLLLITSFYRFVKAKKINPKMDNFYIVILIFFFSLSATESLIRLQLFSNFIFCYALLGLNIISNKVINASRRQQVIVSISTINE